MNTDPEGLKLDMLVRALEKRPTEQRKLAEAAERLGSVAKQVRNVNFQNKELIDSALEMIEFEMNILQSARRAPETANYSKDAYSTGDVLGTGSGKFDAKQ